MQLGSRELAWHDSVENLFHYVSNYMPFDRPATLSEEQYMDVLAFLLYRVGLLPADRIVTFNSMDTITLPSYR